MKKNKIVILGAGVSGLTAAYELARHNIKALVVEKDPKYVGGLAKTIKFKGCRFDIGVNFHSDHPERYFRKQKWYSYVSSAMVLETSFSCNAALLFEVE